MRPDLLRAICFDIGGTLVEMERGTLAEEISALLGVDRPLVRDLLIEHGKRRRTTPDSLGAVVAEGCGRREDAGVVADVIRRRRTDISQPRLYADAVTTLETLTRGGWRIFYLSNAVGYLDPGPVPDFYSYAELVLHSWEIGFCTPEPTAFRAVIDRTGLEPHTIVHVGDSWESNVIGALAAGWQAIHLSRDEESPATSHPDVPRIGTLLELVDFLPPGPVTEATTAELRGRA
ncbi:HAD family hydrolase [Planosporangium sp. 12N6]|uniref:HAD family hydrolase n=1 Tax=Planosporangium spinosum TaxID=3402278 RepID=UPI003CF5A297